MLKLNENKEWLLKKAEDEANCSFSVGGLVTRLAQPTQENPNPVDRLALSRLISLRRRERGLSKPELAERANIDVTELVTIERGDTSFVEPRTVRRLAQYLDLPSRRLMVLSGLLIAKDSRFTQATVKFAACSEQLEKLKPTSEELAVLEEYVKVLVES